MKENVLLLAMSTLNNANEFTYKYDDLYFKGISSLEPHTKYLIKKLQDNNEQLDRIVILTTPETEKSLRPDDEAGMNVIQLYKKRIQAYAMGKQGDLFLDLFPGLKRKHEEIPETLPKTKVEMNDSAFITVDLSNNLFYWEAVNRILGNDDSPVNLYLDIQGGDRSIIAKMNAIAELLGEKNVSIVERYANNFMPRSEEVFTIRDVSDEYQTYDLITAMTIFRDFGRGDKLVEFFSKKKDERAKKLTETISEASNAIQLCDVDGFDEAVRKIEKLQDVFDYSAQNNTRERGEIEKSEIDIVYEEIKNDYLPLFNAKYRFVEQIRWCIKKRFYQQAITILESKMPQEYVKSGLKYYCRKNEEGKVRAKFEKIYLKMQQKEKYRMKDINHFFICDYDRFRKELSVKEDQSVSAWYGIEEEEVNKNINKYIKIKGERNSVNHVSSMHNRQGFYDYIKNKYPADKAWRKNSQANINSLIGTITTYLNKFEELADRVSEEVKNSVVDLY